MVYIHGTEEETKDNAELSQLRSESFICVLASPVLALFVCIGDKYISVIDFLLTYALFIFIVYIFLYGIASILLRLFDSNNFFKKEVWIKALIKCLIITLSFCGIVIMLTINNLIVT